MPVARIALIILAAFVSQSSFPSAIGGPVSGSPAENAAAEASRYLVSRQGEDGAVRAFSPVGSTADAVLAFVAAGRAPQAVRKALEFLETQVNEATVGQKAKIAMAAIAGGRDPRDFGGSDLVADLKSRQNEDGQFVGESSEGQVFTHALVMLALRSANEDVEQSADEWLANAQCEGGGWRFDAPATPDDDTDCSSADGSATADTNTTSLAVQALASTPAEIDPPSSPFHFFDKARDVRKNGWLYTLPRYCMDCLTDANSTSLVLQAYAVSDIRPPRGARSALLNLRYKSCGDLFGTFAYSWERRNGELARFPSKSDARKAAETVTGATLSAVLGVLLQELPVPPRDSFRPPPPRDC